MRGGTSQAPQQSEPSSVSSTPAPIPVITLAPEREAIASRDSAVGIVVFWVLILVAYAD